MKKSKFKKQFYGYLLKKGKNSIYVFPGCGYELQRISTNMDSMSIEELAYICLKAGKGNLMFEDIESDFYPNSETWKELENSGSYTYVDLTEYGLGLALFDTLHLSTRGVEVHS